MKRYKITALLLTVFIFLSTVSCTPAEKSEDNTQSNFIDIAQVRPEIEARDKQFSEAFRNQDSVALANFYASNGTLGSIIGKDNLVTTLNRMIQSAIEDGRPNLLFTISSLTSDEEYVVELGIYQFVDTDGNVKEHGKYVVVWKQEDGKWKIYRDVGL